MKYFLVICKCGHVGRGKYVEKTFPIYAHNKKEAAAIGRAKGRVKHHDKYAIRDVKEITFEEYKAQVKINESDGYLNVSSVQEQRRTCPDIYDQVIVEEEPPSYKRKREKRRLIEESSLKEITKYKSYLNYE